MSLGASGESWIDLPRMGYASQPDFQTLTQSLRKGDIALTGIARPYEEVRADLGAESAAGCLPNVRKYGAAQLTLNDCTSGGWGDRRNTPPGLSRTSSPGGIRNEEPYGLLRFRPESALSGAEGSRSSTGRVIPPMGNVRIVSADLRECDATTAR